MIRLKFKLRLIAGKSAIFYRREDGATAVEFAILALPFFLLMFGILELAAVFFVQSNVQNASYEAARRVRTGEFTGTTADLQDIICTQMNPNITTTELPNCRNRLTVSVDQLGDFSATTSFDPNAPTPTSTGVVTSTSGGDTVLMEVIYQHDLALPGTFTRLINTPQPDPLLANPPPRKNARNIKVVTAFRNEPF